jgi:toxin-antitoxin system PIN domain toxin
VILPDVNVLIYAFRSDAPHHQVCATWLEHIVESDSHFGIAPLALAALVRITTNVRSFNKPSPIEEAYRFCDYLLDQSHCQAVEPRDRHWSIFRNLVTDTNTRGRRVSDAWYAALAIEWGCEWITMDRDFARFPGLKWSSPTI